MASNRRAGEKIFVRERCVFAFLPAREMEQRVKEKGRRHESQR